MRRKELQPIPSSQEDGLTMNPVNFKPMQPAELLQNPRIYTLELLYYRAGPSRSRLHPCFWELMVGAQKYPKRHPRNEGRATGATKLQRASTPSH